MTEQTKLTLQEMFDKAYIGVVKQGGPSVGEDGMCMYRSKEGNRCCGVGHIIPDSGYDSEIENWCVYSVLDRFSDEINLTAKKLVAALIAGNVDVEDQHTLKFLDRLQDVHDNAFLTYENTTDEQFLEEFVVKMSDVAITYNLTVPQLS